MWEKAKEGRNISKLLLDNSHDITCGQFHQHFIHGFFVRKCLEQIFCTYILGLYFFGKKVAAPKLLLKCWWISSTFKCAIAQGFAQKQSFSFTNRIAINSNRTQIYKLRYTFHAIYQKDQSNLLTQKPPRECWRNWHLGVNPTKTFIFVNQIFFCFCY